VAYVGGLLADWAGWAIRSDHGPSGPRPGGHWRPHAGAGRWLSSQGQTGLEICGRLSQAACGLHRGWQRLGALIYGFLPEDLVVSVVKSAGVLAIPIAALIGTPLYLVRLRWCDRVLPVAEGMSNGAIIAFLITAVSISPPELIMLGALFKRKYIVAFAVTIMTLAAIITGYVSLYSSAAESSHGRAEEDRDHAGIGGLLLIVSGPGGQAGRAAPAAGHRNKPGIAAGVHGCFPAVAFLAGNGFGEHRRGAGDSGPLPKFGLGSLRRWSASASCLSAAHPRRMC